MTVAAMPGSAESLLDALLSGDAANAADALEDAMGHGVDPIDVLDDVLTPAMHEVGRLWERGTIGVSEEHLAASVVNRMLTRLAPLLITAPACSGPAVLMAAAQGERHVLGLQMAAGVLDGAGYTVKYAGADLPARALLAFAERERPALVAIACTGSWAPAADIGNAITQLITVQPDIGVLLGGTGWKGFPVPENGRVVLVDSMRDLLPVAARLSPAD